ncbi:hypothetical protein Cob_v008738 [Colletotrichum orbiculare MAFF 240422]|uniref:Uncharacterized protein n=1 Tax=Colletotrichum orbiculare (strain 104-T / ATCC 96160 / CBS 514.97 / LARS 414 / MAFF 240422) TaxID=1213857 RepID=A0A484FN17_COLOR|nr:hypothetical protein Cob_v008738 [Colletotrichum orbiculare MAFF 240422]
MSTNHSIVAGRRKFELDFVSARCFCSPFSPPFFPPRGYVRWSILHLWQSNISSGLVVVWVPAGDHGHDHTDDTVLSRKLPDRAKKPGTKKLARCSAGGIIISSCRGGGDCQSDYAVRCAFK